MSDQTRAALDEAIRAHVADEAPDTGMAVHWAIAVGLYDDDEHGGEPVWVDAPAGQPGYVTAGLFHTVLNPPDYEEDA